MNVLPSAAKSSWVTPRPFSSRPPASPYGFPPGAPRGDFTHWREAFRKAQAGAGQAKVVVFGDSITAGSGSLPTPFYENAWPGQMKTLIDRAVGVDTGTGWVPLYEEFLNTDARSSVTGSWARHIFSGPYRYDYYNNAGAATYTFGPVRCSQFRIMYTKFGSGGAWTAQIDSQPAISFSSASATNNPPTVATLECGSDDLHTLTLSATGIMFVEMIEAVRNPSSGVAVSRVAISGMTLGNLVATSYGGFDSYYSMLAADADLAILGFGVNESVGSIAMSTFRSDIQTAIDGLKGISCSAVLMATLWPDPAAGGGTALYADYLATMKQVAAANNAGFLSTAEAIGSKTNKPQFYQDNLHPSLAGAAEMARLATSYVLAAAH